MASAYYTSVNKIRRASYTVGHGGIGVAVLDIVPQPAISLEPGTLVLSDGFNSVIVQGCKIDKSRIVVGIDGHIEQITVLDATWKWRFGTLYGTYNVKLPDGTVDPATEKTPQQLATLAFEAMNVNGADVTLLPNDDDDRPFVDWMCSSARGAIQWLCERAGCDFGRNVIGGGAAIWALGSGLPLPADGDVQTVDYGADVGEIPDTIEITTDPTRFQAKLMLEPVGIETDGSVKRLDELSYMPAGGWTGTDPENPLPPTASELEQYLAKKSYLRMWRVSSMSDGTLNLPGYGEIDSIDLILPLQDEMAEGYVNDDGATYRKEPYLEGTRAVPGEPASLTNTGTFTRIDVGFHTDKEAGVVFVDTPLFKYDGNLNVVAADVHLVSSFHLRNSSGDFHRYRWTQDVADNGTGSLGKHRPDLEYRVLAQYASGDSSGEAIGVTTNSTTLDAALSDQAQAMLSEYQSVESHVVRYRNIKQIVLDGAIRQVTWMVDCGSESRDGGVWTIASRNTESTIGVPNRRERRRVLQTDRTTAVRELEEHWRRRLTRKGLA